MRTARTIVGIAVAATVVTALAGCTVGQADPRPSADPASAFSQSHTVSAAWSTDVTPIADPSFADDTVLAYDGTDDVHLVALDAATGEQRWSAPSSTGAVVPTWTAFSVVTTETADGGALVAYLTPPVLDQGIDYYQHTLVLADVRTGEVVHESPRDWVAGVWSCGLDRNVCYSTWDVAAETWVSKEMDVDTGEVGPLTTQVDGRHTDVLEEGVYSYTDSAGTAWFGRRTDGEDRWKVRAASLLGQDVDTVGRLRAVTVAPGTGDLLLNMSTAKTADVKSLPVGDLVLVALDPDTGKRKWSTTGTLCTGLDLMVCRGDVAYTAAGENAGFDIGRGDVEIAGLDAETGDDRWETTASGVESLGNSRAQGGLGSLEDAWVYRDAQGVRLLTDDGRKSRLPEDASTACKSSLRWNGHESSNPENALTEFHLGSSWALCDATGKAVTGEWTQGSVLAASDMPDGWRSGQRVVQTKDALLGFDLGE